MHLDRRATWKTVYKERSCGPRFERILRGGLGSRLGARREESRRKALSEARRWNRSWHRTFDARFNTRVSISRDELLAVYKVAQIWKPYCGRVQTGRAISLLVSMGLDHLLSCVLNGEEIKISPEQLKERGVQFTRYVKGMRF